MFLKNLLAAAAIISISWPVVATESNTGVSTSILSTSQSPGGLSIVLPQKDVRVTATLLEVKPGDAIPEPEHPYSRYGYLLAGSLKITNTRSGKVEIYKPGDFIIFDHAVETLGHWRQGASIGTEDVKMLVIDQVEANPSNFVVSR